MARPTARLGMAAVAVALIGALAFAVASEPDPRQEESNPESDARGPLERACDLEPELVARIWRGNDPKRSEDIVLVPKEPNYSGNFAGPSHSGPWDYLQKVPLVLYGPGFIAPSGEIHNQASITDVFPTVGALLDTDLPHRDGDILEQALVATDDVPRLVIVIVWDGAGRNVLERWPNEWPNLARLTKEGTSYLNATVGSSPSITPATHSSLGTGVFPRTHRVTGIEYRTDKGEIAESFFRKDPSPLASSTFADLVDAAFGNESLVGMLASHSWHIGMLGHGSSIEGGDKDQAAFLSRKGLEADAGRYFEAPTYLNDFVELNSHVEDADLSDGELDGEWLGNEIVDARQTPAHAFFQAEFVQEMIAREGYGQDEVPDLFLVNFKTIDTIGHSETMDSPQMREVVGAEDEILGELVAQLDSEIGEYVLILTADHGHTPSPERSGGWPIANGELIRDLDAHFDVPEEKSLVEESVAVGLFLDGAVLEQTGTTQMEIADFLDDYAIANNWQEPDLPAAYRDRANERVFSAVFPTNELEKVVDCVFEGGRPPVDPD
ncbi:MAG: alkaline phosphatase family protein [Actinomycetota bacterium]|nr:alkaline phosphatase family protein [Actinomycetota bacterium]